MEPGDPGPPVTRGEDGSDGTSPAAPTAQKPGPSPQAEPKGVRISGYWRGHERTVDEVDALDHE